MLPSCCHSTDTEAALESSSPLNPSSKGKPRKKMPATTKRPLKERCSVQWMVITVLIVLTLLGLLITGAYFLKILIDTNFFFCKTSFKFIPRSKVCDGKADCANREDELMCVTNLTINSSFPVRLVTNSSVLQVYTRSGSWRLVCGEGWQIQHTQQVCQQLGFSSNPSSSTVAVNLLPSSIKTGFSAVAPKNGTASGISDLLTDKPSCTSGSVIALSCSECGLTLGLEDRIVGGTDTTVEHWPWQVSLKINGQHTCGGSLVTPRWLVTAAHCVASTGNEVDQWTVQTAQTSLSSSGEPVDKVIINGQYSSENNDYDIAMMRLVTPIKLQGTSYPVCLPPYGQQLKANQSLWVTGWGYTQERGKVSTILQQANIPLIDRATCLQLYGSIITPRMLCAGFVQGKVDACQGDSGGPLVLMDDRWQLAGIVSWGVGCARANWPGVYSNVDELLDWIYTVMQKNP
ncbi:transmembrane protease serine 3 isoform X2 [Amia ocellicauda]|uniref:transmembrane protease serine 3 isoform X2 n=1 Tax=Amia ocellicauda TaxID=2972642 RepID=UPI0034649307